ncbi:MAG: hypothetical protein H6570_01960 [Lewinellaceae bacterium]|nr:hypothetical protein [Lewinellaceae bacterium]
MLILEHFADIEEETVLADHGFLLWNNVNGAYIQAATGYNGNLSGASYTIRIEYPECGVLHGKSR